MAEYPLHPESARANPVSAVDLSPQASAYQAAVLECCNSLFDLSIKAGAVAGLLDMISHAEKELGNNRAMGLAALGDMAQEVENKICQISQALSEADDAARGLAAS